MSNLELFLLGLGVTLLTAVALALLIWAAIQDGRYNDGRSLLVAETFRASQRTPCNPVRARSPCGTTRVHRGWNPPHAACAWCSAA